MDGLDKRKAIYEQDCQFYRYQDQKKWERFKTAAIVEGAIFYTLYGTDRVGALEKRAAIVFGFVILAIALLISLKDQADADGHKIRIKDYENEYPYRAPVKTRWGRHLMTALIVLLLVLHLGLGTLAWVKL